MTATVPALQLRLIDKRFGITVALSKASLTVQPGTLHVLLGENGAGKTTLLNVAAGLQRPDSGEVLLGNQLVHWRSRRDAIAAGVGAVQQQFSLVPAMSVAENVMLGEHGVARYFAPRDVADRVRRIAADASLDVDPDAIVADLSIAARQRAEIVKAIIGHPNVLLLDEPTSALSPPDIVDLFAWLRAFVARGRAVVVITHRLREAMRYGDALTIIRSGQVVIASSVSSLSEGEILSAMIGEAGPAPIVGSAPPLPHRPIHSAQISTRHVSVVDDIGVARLRDVTLTVYPGEILGICGVEGAGQYELLRLLSGRRQPSSGSVVLPRTVGFIPEDRAAEALIEALPLMENLALHGAGSRRGLMRWQSLSARTDDALHAFDVRGGRSSTLAGALSGGNQQRFVLARELGTAPDAVIAENPTRGLDVRGSRAVFERLRGVRAAGASVVIYSSDIEEIVSLADRVVVCHAGYVREVPVEAGAIGAAMVGA